MPSRPACHRLTLVGHLLASALLIACIATGAGAGAASAPVLHFGLARVRTAPLPGALNPEPPPRPATYRTGEAARQAAPTNQWYSSALFWRWSEPLYALPMTYRTTAAGFEVGLPTRQVVLDDDRRRHEVRYLHAAAITVVPTAFKPTDSRVARHSDWLVELELAADRGAALRATVLHGSPFSYYECTTGDVRFHLSGTPVALWNPVDGGHDPRVLAFTLGGHGYAIFAPHGARWDWSHPADPVLHLPPAARYFSIAGLPDPGDSALQRLLRVAYAFPVETRTEWQYDEHASRVRVTYRVRTVAREGTATATVLGLYPHQWAAMRTSTAGAPQYDSVRGPIRLIEGNEFTTERTYHGFVPSWGALSDPTDRAAVRALLATDVAAALRADAPADLGTYWTGKRLGALAQLLAIAEAEGLTAERTALLGELKAVQERWYDGRHASYFQYDAGLGALFGYPQEYHSVSNVNDHHFHYGYWVTAAANVALRDRGWATPDRWGGMVRQVVADIATAERGRADYPFLRNFDSYEGHSWASGTAEYDAGNNQESSSEAINAWAGLVLLGEALGDRALRDLGIYLYTTEIASVQQYWFDLDHRVLAPEFGAPFASLVFGGKYAHGTWWTAEPRQILGINLLPFTGASTYLGEDPEFVRRSLAALPREVSAYRAQGTTDGTPADVWQDVLACYRALADPDAALAAWNPASYVEFGETRTHTRYWLSSLHEMGVPDFGVTADTPLYAVFRRDGRRTYLAYDARDTALKVTFSDGRVLDVPPHSLARAP